ncbi:MAG: hypothetical protein KGL74_05195, partial [Elusimicrobia bacterium]|nr:hypothetical protein [Elusimicrobiota bacterium]
FAFCAYGLRLGEAPAYKRIRAARAIRLFPPILPLLRDGRLTLEGVAMLHPHLEGPDVAGLVTKASGLRIKALEALLSDLRPAKEERDMIRFTGSQMVPSASGVEPGISTLPFSQDSAHAHVVKTPGISPRTQPSPMPENSARTRLLRISFTANEEFFRLLEKARASLRHKYPDSRLEGVLRDALALLVERRDPVLRWRTRREARKRQNMS